MRLPKFWGVMILLAFFFFGTILTGEAIKNAAHGESAHIGTPLLIPAFVFLLFWIWELQKRLQELQEELKRLKES